VIKQQREKAPKF